MRPPCLSNPRSTGLQYLEDLATGYWFSEVLFTAVELEIFTLLEPAGKTAAEAAGMTGSNPRGMERFLTALCALGLLGREGPLFLNTENSRYLVKGQEDYQGDSILWRKHLTTSWQSLKECLKEGGRVIYPTCEHEEGLKRRMQKYILAMDAVARTKVREILPIFEGLFTEGEILDVGAGSGAIAAGFLEHFPSLRATLLDLPPALDLASDLMRKRKLEERVTLHPANILEPWPTEIERFDLVVLSNIIHAYSDSEIPHVLASASECLKQQGFLLIHDFFPEHYPEKAALFDLNMFINTYNGRIFSEGWIIDRLNTLKLYSTGLIPMKTDTALIIASKNKKALSNLPLEQKQ